jgi:hypothetical protein
MSVRQIFSFMVICIALCWIGQGKAQVQQQKAPARLYNTAKQKLKDGKPLVGATVFSLDPNIYCAMANAGYDYLWIEMQHSPLTYEDVAKMIWACRGATAMPFIRVPDATESDIQKATDIGALGIIVPTVDTVEKAQAAVKWSKYPPEGRRSQGNGQYGALWGSDYRQTANVSAWRTPRRSPLFPGSMSSSPLAPTWAIFRDIVKEKKNTKHWSREFMT